MLSSTKALYDFLRHSGDVVSEAPESGFEPDAEMPESHSFLTVKLKKKRQNLILKKMLSDGGYPDLAKMISIGKESRDFGDDENR